VIALFKQYRYDDIKGKLLILYGLNIIDLLSTLFLVNTGFFIEANPIMAHFMDGPLNTVLFKLAMPATLIVALAARLRTATPDQRRKSNHLINLLLLVYMAVAVLHIVWITVYYVMCV